MLLMIRLLKLSARMLLVFLIFLSIFTLFLIKSKTMPEFRLDPFLYGYALFIIMFLMFRVGGALFYKLSLKNILSAGEMNALGYEPTVTFVIPCKNEEASIHTTVAKCFAADYPKDKLEVIVIDDGSTDRTYPILLDLKRNSYPDLTIVHWEKNRGKRQGMAAGFRMAKGEIVVQLDSDSYIEPRTFRNLILPFANPEIAAVCAHADPTNAGENIVTKMQAAYYFISFRIMKAAESTFYTVFCCSGCSSAYRKAAVLPIIDPWLKESFLGELVTYGDDRAMTSWLLKNGHKTIYSDAVQAYTIVPNNLKTLFRQQLRWKKSWVINSIFTGRFIAGKQPFIAFAYFYPLIIISYLAPIMAFRSLVYAPLVESRSPVYYVLGIVTITAFVVLLGKWFAQGRKYLGYFFVWQLLNTVAFTYIIFYALFRIRDRSWGTR